MRRTVDGPRGPVVDWARAGRRLRASALVLGALAVGGWVVTGLVAGDIDPARLGNWVGLALAGMFAVEVVVVGGSAVRGLLRAGDRGDRLAGPDVSVVPPQLTRRTR